MSRSGYGCYSEYGNQINLYRGRVTRAIRGKRGQKFLVELALAMDAMPEKKLIRNELIAENGEMCTIGVICKTRGIDVKGVEVDDSEQVADLVGIAQSMASEIEYENDECGRLKETSDDRWIRMRKWVDRQIVRK